MPRHAQGRVLRSAREGGAWRTGELWCRSMASPESSALDRWTVAAIAVVAYAVGNVVHEGLGHGGACVLVGGRPLELNAIFFECSMDGLPPSARRWLAAGGSIANLIVAALAWIALRTLPRDWGRARHFAWLL